MPQLSIEIPEAVMKEIDEEILRRKIRRPEQLNAPDSELEEAYKIAESDGTPAANTYLRERFAARKAAAKTNSTSRRGLILEFFLVAFLSRSKIAPLPLTKKKELDFSYKDLKDKKGKWLTVKQIAARDKRSKKKAAPPTEAPAAAG